MGKSVQEHSSICMFLIKCQLHTLLTKQFT